MAEVLRIDPNAKIIIASGYSESGSANGAMVVGAKGFVQKPYNMRQILDYDSRDTGQGLIGKTYMQDQDKNREQLIDELNEMRSRLAETDLKKCLRDIHGQNEFLNNVIESLPIPSMLSMSTITLLRWRIRQAGSSKVPESHRHAIGLPTIVMNRVLWKEIHTL